MKPHEKIHWHGHDAFRLVGTDRTIWIDPYDLPDPVAKGDLVLVTHQHHDHLSPADIAKVSKDHTVVVAPPDCQAQLTGAKEAMKPGERREFAGGIVVETIPAYNVNKQFHPRAAGWVGYIVTLDGVRIYHAGDSDFIDEMKALAVDVALLPVSGTYVMTADEAAAAARAMKVQTVIPMHYGSVVGSPRDADTFAAALAGHVPVVIKSRE